MSPNPLTYGVELVVATRHQQRWRYFISEADLWILDHEAWYRPYREKGYQLGEPGQERFGMAVVNSDNAAQFFTAMSAFEIPREVLAQRLAFFDERRSLEPWAELGYRSYLPALLVDFDDKLVVNAFLESFPFARFLPQEWRTEHAALMRYMPQSEQYWSVHQGALEP